MKRTILAAVILAGAALATPAIAADFTFSDAFGTGEFRYSHCVTLGHRWIRPIPPGHDQHGPNFIVDTGSHFALTLSLLGTGRIDQSSFNLSLSTLHIATSPTQVAPLIDKTYTPTAHW